MSRLSILRIVVAVCVATALACDLYFLVHPAGLPFAPRFTDAQTAVVVPIRGAELPPGLSAGDSIDLPALDTETRSALLVSITLTNNMQLGSSYTLKVRKGGTDVSVPVSTVGFAAVSAERINLIYLYVQFLFSIVALLLLWRGRDNSTRLLAFWALGYVGGYFVRSLPLAGDGLFIGDAISWLSFFVARVALYGAAESMAGTALPARTRIALRIGLVLTMAFGLVTLLTGRWLFLTQGSTAGLTPAVTWLIATPYLMPATALFIAYRHTSGAKKIRVGWLLWSLLPFFMGILIRDLNSFGFVVTALADAIGISLALTGILYAILRHRVLDVSVVLDRTLVYGAMTALVVGALAAVNSLALRATLGEGTGLLLQIVVPLALGIVLGKVRTYLDRFVERVFFRSKYLAEKALKRFAAQCGHINDLMRLMDSAVTEICTHTGSPGAAFYASTSQGYFCVRQVGAVKYPKNLGLDDAGLVAARAERRPVDLDDLASTLGKDSCVFPMMVLGVLRGVMVCANRPGEHYAADERKLLMKVARSVGLARRILLARDNGEFVHAVAHAEISAKTVGKRARALDIAWSGA